MNNNTQTTKTISLEKYGIKDVAEIVYNPSYDFLYNEELSSNLQGFERGHLTELGAVNVMTGIYTGRSPKDKYIVKDDVTKDTIWWTSDKAVNDNKPISTDTWNALKATTVSQLSGKRLFVIDAFCGANEDTRLKVRFVMEVAWQAHFVTNMFIRPSIYELENFGEHILLCNFQDYVTRFAEMHNVEVIGNDKPMQCATAEGITIINFGMGSASAATCMDLLSAIEPKAVLFLGKCGGLKKKKLWYVNLDIIDQTTFLY